MCTKKVVSLHPNRPHHMTTNAKPRYKKTQEVKDLEISIAEKMNRDHPGIPSYAIPKVSRRDDTANGLTRCIIDFLSINGHQAERINSMGRVVMERGHQLRGGKLVDTTTPRYIPTNATNGTSDISAIIGGRAVKIEVKIGRDRQSEVQKRYQDDVERSGGVYFVARNFSDFVSWYTSTFAS